MPGLASPRPSAVRPPSPRRPALVAAALALTALLAWAATPRPVTTPTPTPTTTRARPTGHRPGPVLLRLPPAALAALPHLPTSAPRPPTPRPPTLPPVAICAIVRDQNADLPEWVAWHLAVGVAHVFLYDHASEPPAAAVLRPFIRSGALTLIRAPRHASAAHPSGRAQLWAYDDCLAVYGKGVPRADAPPGVDEGAWADVVGALDTSPAPPAPPPPPLFPWLAFIDVDEFIMPSPGNASAAASAGDDGDPRRDAVPAALAAFGAAHPSAGGLALNWVIFGSSGHATHPAGGTLASYTACLPASDRENAHVKSIVRPDRALRVGSDPHHFLYTAGHPAANGRGQAIPGPIAPPALGLPSYEGLALFHYATKSADEYEKKMARGSGMGNAKKAAWLASVDGRAVDECVWGKEMGERVRQRGGFEGVVL